MDEQEILVTEEEQVAENVEQTTEETPAKTYTQEEVDAIVGKRLARKEARIRKEYDRQYGDLMEVLKAGTQEEDVGKIADTFRGFYEKKGIQISKKPEYDAGDIEVLANAEAAEIIRGGYEEVAEEVDRLANIGVANMNPREKAIFKALAEHRQKADRERELSSMGVTEDVWGSKEFKDFASRYRADIPIKEVYEDFRKIKHKPITNMGSMKQGQRSAAKDYYTPEEIERLTMQDLDDPKVWEAVRRSMTGR